MHEDRKNRGWSKALSAEALTARRRMKNMLACTNTMRAENTKININRWPESESVLFFVFLFFFRSRTEAATTQLPVIAKKVMQSCRRIRKWETRGEEPLRREEPRGEIKPGDSRTLADWCVWKTLSALEMTEFIVDASTASVCCSFSLQQRSLGANATVVRAKGCLFIQIILVMYYLFSFLKPKHVIKSNHLRAIKSDLGLFFFFFVGVSWKLHLPVVRISLASWPILIFILIWFWVSPSQKKKKKKTLQNIMFSKVCCEVFLVL